MLEKVCVTLQKKKKRHFFKNVGKHKKILSFVSFVSSFIIILPLLIDPYRTKTTKDAPPTE